MDAGVPDREGAGDTAGVHGVATEVCVVGAIRRGVAITDVRGISFDSDFLDSRSARQGVEINAGDACAGAKLPPDVTWCCGAERELHAQSLQPDRHAEDERVQVTRSVGIQTATGSEHADDGARCHRDVHRNTLNPDYSG